MADDPGLFNLAQEHARRAAANKIRRDGNFDVHASGPKEGSIVASSQHNFKQALELMKVDLSYNEFANKMLICNGTTHNVENVHVNTLRFQIDKNYHFLPPKEQTFDLIEVLAHEKTFHPVRDYFASLVWDGTPRIDTWLTAYGGAEDTPFNRAISRIVLVAACRRVRQPGCKFDNVLVLESPTQGTGKSTMVQILAVRSEWFSNTIPLNKGPRETIEQCSGKFIIELAELSGIHKSDIEHTKNFFSSEKDTARLAYGHFATEVKRQFIVIGTTNAAHYLRDNTGNRRFWPVLVTIIDLEALARDVDQLWAEAAAAEAAGETIILDSSLWPTSEEVQDERRIHDPWDEIINKWVGERTGRIIGVDAWDIIGMPPERRPPEGNTRLGATMRACGFEHKRQMINGKQQWGYSRGNSPVVMRIRPNPGGVVTIEGELPPGHGGNTSGHVKPVYWHAQARAWQDQPATGETADRGDDIPF